MIRYIVIVSCFLLLHGSGLTQKDFHAWAATPPMGWNSWDCFGPTVTESEVKANADYMSEKLKAFGWNYIVVDIRWYVSNDKAHGYNETDPDYVLDKYGRFMPAVNRFPSAKDGRFMPSSARRRKSRLKKPSSSIFYMGWVKRFGKRSSRMICIG